MQVQLVVADNCSGLLILGVQVRVKEISQKTYICSELANCCLNFYVRSTDDRVQAPLSGSNDVQTWTRLNKVFHSNYGVCVCARIGIVEITRYLNLFDIRTHAILNIRGHIGI